MSDHLASTPGGPSKGPRSVPDARMLRNWPAGDASAAERERRRLLDLVNSLEAVVWEADPQTWRFTFVSDAAERLLHLLPSRWLSDHSMWLRLIHPDDRPRWGEFQKACVRSHDAREFNCRVQPRPDRMIWLKVIVRPVWRRDQLVMLRGVMVDVTRTVEAEQARERLIGDLQRTQEALRRTLRVRDEVLGVVAHDLRNPANTIMMTAATLAELPLDAEERIRHARIIERAARTMDHLIADLLDVSRMESGRIAIRCAPVLLNDLIRETAEQFSPQASAHGLRLETSALSEPLWVNADRDRLRQVLSNLLGNAIKFTPRGGVVRLQAVRNGGEIEIRVRDNGKGIAPEHLPHIFERFWQADRRARFGAGLGLSIAKTIVHAHGGRITVDSTPDQGATFTFTVPAFNV